MVRDRLVCGIANSSTQKRLLAEPELTLKKAQTLAQTIESAERNVKELQGQRQPPVSSTMHAVTQRRGAPKRPWTRTDSGKTAADTQSQCHRCGGKHSPHDCRFKTAECHSCKKRGHLYPGCAVQRERSLRPRVGRVVVENHSKRIRLRAECNNLETHEATEKRTHYSRWTHREPTQLRSR